ncbi:hypothetical protein PR202_gn00246 [Eleusine coracana subsp. coracana]|uniref:Uncharacterized protein n=1 Tax=Eleusine coracana subsp. coracana TaxID=191504 RepID=A0AAV5G1Y1_ELECO|nr:hypothetical protein PR202_gn00141 [Eleusine coracana subsp. coracana]GJN40933.1 hypothetical protein PR202_gn00246 [Eleusine coracana subsp. coracana]
MVRGVEMETHDGKGSLLLSFLLRQPATTNYFLPPFSPPLSPFSDLSFSPLHSLFSLNSTVLAFRRTLSRISSPFLAGVLVSVLRGPLEATAGVIRGRSRAPRLGGVGSPDVYRLLIHPDPGSAAKAAPLWLSAPWWRVWFVGSEAGIWFSSRFGLVRRGLEEASGWAAICGGGHRSTAARRGVGCLGGSGGSSGSSSSLASCSSSFTTTRRSNSGRQS